MAAELSDAYRRKSEFLATLAHGLRNPLAPIRSGLDLVESIEGVLPEVARVHAMMSRQVEQLTRLVDEPEWNCRQEGSVGTPSCS